MGEDLRGRLERFPVEGRVSEGVATTLEGAVHDAWARIDDEGLKPQGLRVTIVVGGGNPIGWYGVILGTG